jgi:hypothetical protein
MGNLTLIFHLLTAVLVILKALNYIDWSWLMVLAPSIFAVVEGIFMLICAVFIAALRK